MVYLVLSSFKPIWGCWTSAPHKLSCHTRPCSTAPQSNYNLFTKCRESRGHVITGAWRPDLFEAESRAASQAAADNQVSLHLRKGATPRMIRQGVPAMEHVKAALRLEDLPFDVPAPFACHHICDRHLAHIEGTG